MFRKPYILIGITYRMEENEIRQLVDRLNREFNVYPCGVRFEDDLGYGRDTFYVDYGYILFSRKYLERITPSIVCHEFAHHLVKHLKRLRREIRAKRKWIREAEKRLGAWDFGYAECQKSALAPARKVERKRRVLHGRDFIRCLRKVIERAGIEYDFSREYATVRKAFLGGKEQGS